MKTITEVRNDFWNTFPQFQNERRSRKRQNDYRADIRFYFIDHVNDLRNSGTISENLANRVTL